MSISINKIIEKLQSIDFSPENINTYGKVLARRKDLLFNIFLIIVAIITIRYILVSGREKTAMMKNNITELKTKQEAAILLENEKKALGDIAAKIPQGFAVDTEIIKTILSLAQANGVNVIDYAPAQPEKTEYFTTQLVDVNLEGPYDSMMAFVDAAEKMDKNLRFVSFEKLPDATVSQNTKAVISENENFRWKAQIASTIKNDE